MSDHALRASVTACHHGSVTTPVWSVQLKGPTSLAYASLHPLHERGTSMTSNRRMKLTPQSLRALLKTLQLLWSSQSLPINRAPTALLSAHSISLTDSAYR